MDKQIKPPLSPFTFFFFLLMLGGPAPASTIHLLRETRLSEEDFTSGERWIAFHFSNKSPGVLRPGFGSHEACQIQMNAPIQNRTFPAGAYAITEDETHPPDLWDNSWKRRIVHENPSRTVRLSLFCKTQSSLNLLSNKYISSVLAGHLRVD